MVRRVGQHSRTRPRERRLTVDITKGSGTEARIKQGCDQRTSGEQEEPQRDYQGTRDHLHDALAAMPMDQRIATINRMAERMGV
jgi:hypothetical protein